MPVWYERVRPLVEAGALQIIGIVQEQHPDRAQLYQQWKGLDFPILWDPFGLSGVEAVPDLTAVDEHGVIRIARPAPKLFETQFMEGFMGRSFEASEGEPVPATFFQVNASARLRGDPLDGGSGAESDGPPDAGGANGPHDRRRGRCAGVGGGRGAASRSVPRGGRPADAVRRAAGACRRPPALHRRLVLCAHGLAEPVHLAAPDSAVGPSAGQALRLLRLGGRRPGGHPSPR